MLGSCVYVIGTNREEIKIPIPFKLIGMHEALEKNFDWIVPENPFDEVNPRVLRKDLLELVWIKYNSLLKRLLVLI
jgi:hypothetical protein